MNSKTPRHDLTVKPIEDGDITEVIALWQRCGLTRAWNDPAAEIGQPPDLQDLARRVDSLELRLAPKPPARSYLAAGEVPVPGGLPRCIRVLLHFYTTQPQRGLKHMYLREAAKLRPDRPTSE